MAEQCVILNDIHIDIMDYIKPAYCTEQQVGWHASTGKRIAFNTWSSQFRSMWTEFEWENRVNVTTTISYVSSGYPKPVTFLTVV